MTTSLLSKFSEMAAQGCDPAPLCRLCDHLGIDNNLPVHVRWMLVGMHLANDHPVFKQTKRGRKPKRGWDVDIERYAVIEFAAMKALPIKRTQTEWIALAVRGELFSDGYLAERQKLLFPARADLNSSVSRGKKQLGGQQRHLFAKK